MRIFEMLGGLNHYVALFIVSALPIVELRAAIPIAAALDMPILSAYLICVVGNMLPVPFIILLARPVFQWLSTKPFFGPFSKKLQAKLLSKADKKNTYTFVGLMLFVAIPFPGTGAWTGSMIAALLNVRFRNAFIAIFFGVLIAGVVMSISSYGLFHLIG